MNIKLYNKDDELLLIGNYNYCKIDFLREITDVHVAQFVTPLPTYESIHEFYAVNKIIRLKLLDGAYMIVDYEEVFTLKNGIFELTPKK